MLLFPGPMGDSCELGYAVGARHRGRRLASRAIEAVLPMAHDEGYRAAVLTIAVDNLPSQAVAVAAGFTQVPGAVQRRERKGYLLEMATWRRALME